MSARKLQEALDFAVSSESRQPRDLAVSHYLGAGPRASRQPDRAVQGAGTGHRRGPPARLPGWRSGASPAAWT